MLRKKIVKFFVIMCVLVSAVGVAGKTTHARSMMPPKVGVEISGNSSIKERMEMIYEELHKKMPEIKDVIKCQSDRIIKEIIQRKDKIIENLVDEMAKKIIKVGEKI